MSKTAPINIRARPEQRAIIDHAARIVGKNRSDFMLEAAFKEAQNVIMDRNVFCVDDKTFQALENALENPVHLDRLKRLLKKKAPWD